MDPIWQLIDREATLQRLAGDEELFCQLATFFLDDVPPLLNDLNTAIQDGNPEMVERTSHSLKGLAANLGGTAATRAAGALEASGRQGKLDNAAILQESIAREFASLCDVLAQYLKARSELSASEES